MQIIDVIDLWHPIANNKEIVFEKEKVISPFKIESNIISVKKEVSDSIEPIEETKIDTTIYEIKVSNQLNLNVPFKIDKSAGRIYRRVYNGNRINIAVIGVDSRLGNRFKLADANHIISILVDSSKIEIISLPRDTKVDFEEKDTAAPKIIARAYSKLNKRNYLNLLALESGFDKIHYWVEIGFSEAMGIIEYLGYKNPASTLQILRDRKSFKAGDFQRNYNQANFIKKQIVSSQKSFDRKFISILLKTFVAVSNSNLDSEKILEIYDNFKQADFTEDDISINVKTESKFHYKDYDFNDNKVVTALTENYSNKRIDFDIYKNLDSILTLCEIDTNKPSKIIRRLERLFHQKAWLQIPELHYRQKLRTRFKEALSFAYSLKGKSQKEKIVLDVIGAEEQLEKYINKNNENINLE